MEKIKRFQTRAHLDQGLAKSGWPPIFVNEVYWNIATPTHYTLSRVTFKLQQQSWGVWQRPYDLQSLKYLFSTSLQKIFLDHCSKYIISPHWSRNSEQEVAGMRSWDAVEQGWQQCSGAREPQAWIKGQVQGPPKTVWLIKSLRGDFTQASPQTILWKMGIDLALQMHEDMSTTWFSWRFIK